MHENIGVAQRTPIDTTVQRLALFLLVSNPGKVALTVSRESAQYSSSDGRSWGTGLGRPVDPHPPVTRQIVKKKQS